MTGSEGRFPRSLIEFQGRFATEAACAKYLFGISTTGSPPLRIACQRHLQGEHRSRQRVDRRAPEMLARREWQGASGLSGGH
jgi:hypothetical protein